MISTPNGFFAKGGNLAMLDRNFNLVANEQAVQAAFHANAISGLRHDEGREYDARMIGVARQRLIMTALFQRLGLVKPLGGLGVILSMYQRSGDFTPAQITMSGRTRVEQDKLTFDELGVPIPIFHKEFEIDHRRLEMSRRMGQPIDTDSISIASRVVTDEWEKHFFTGIPNISVAGNQAYGLLTHPNRNTLTLTAPWHTATGAQILADVNRMIQAAFDDLYHGPYVLMLPKNVWLNMGNDFKAEGSSTILERIQALPDIQEVVCADYLTAGNVILFQATTDVVDLAVAQDLDNIPWQTQPMQTEYKVFTAGAIRVKSDISGKSGVVHGAP